MTGAPDRRRGAYTIDDLDALPDEGTRSEHVTGRIRTVPWPSTFHDHAAKILERALDDAATAAGADGRYHVTASATPDAPLKAEDPFPFSFDTTRLVG